MRRISELVPSLYYTGTNDLVRFLEALDVEVDLIEKSVREIVNLTDVDKCPDDKLPYLANLVGCPLPGTNPAIHRRMLRNWPWLLKIKGTELSFNVYLNSIGAMNHRIPTYFRNAEGEYVEDKPEGEPFKSNGIWYNIRTHYFGLETTWNGEEITKYEHWHEDFVEQVSWWLRRMKPFHAELLRWVTTIEYNGKMNLCHGIGSFHGHVQHITSSRRKKYTINLFNGNCICQGKIIRIGSV